MHLMLRRAVKARPCGDVDGAPLSADIAKVIYRLTGAGTCPRSTPRAPQPRYASDVPSDHANDHPSAESLAEAPAEICAICGRELWSDGLAPALDGDAWICGDCDAARNLTALDL
jgi:hypothetical protein